MFRIPRRVKYSLFSIFLLAVLWEGAVDFSLLDPNLCPSPSMIVQNMFRLLVYNSLLLKIIVSSLYRLFLGYLLSVAFGVSLGILISVNQYFRTMVSPILSFFISVPTLAWVPLFLIAIGPSEETVVVTIFVASFFPIVYSTINGIRNLDKKYIWLAKIMGADKQDIYLKVLLPGALAAIIPGLRLAIGYAWRALVGAEMLTTGISLGIGSMIYASRAFNDVTTMFTGLVLISLIGLFMDSILMGELEKRTVRLWGMVK